MPVLLESRQPGAPKWYRHPVPIPEGTTSSFSSTRPEVREVYLFGWHNGFPGVWVDRAGADIDLGYGGRVIHSVKGLDLLHDLRDGPYQLHVWLKGVHLEYRIRLDTETDEEDSIRQTIQTLVNEKQHDILTMYLTMCVFAQRGALAEETFRQAVMEATDHDVRHYWLNENCPCNAHLSN